MRKRSTESHAHPDAFDLVITGMTMPNMTGDWLAREVQGIKPGIPVLKYEMAQLIRKVLEGEK